MYSFVYSEIEAGNEYPVRVLVHQKIPGIKGHPT